MNERFDLVSFVRFGDNFRRRKLEKSELVAIDLKLRGFGRSSTAALLLGFPPTTNTFTSSLSLVVAET